MTLSTMKLLYQGAEARVFKLPFFFLPHDGTSSNVVKEAVCKERFRKTYRHPTLDEKLTSRRVLQEARCLVRCKRIGIDTPTLYLVDLKSNILYMEYIQGVTMRQRLNENQRQYHRDAHLATQMGLVLAKLHNMDLIHGDLTTSNVMIRDENESLVLLDFGLSYVCSMAEDKAVDLYVLERALSSTHPDSEQFFEWILKEYIQHVHDSEVIMSRLEEEVRLRGRKRTAFG